jgi:DNA repair protein SbcC/Rad50
MKFKKVEISAFRIFDNPEDATFDFTNQTGDIANFISLYAPNGFGKTSFYDAVEWGVTNNISRFWHNKITEESIDALRELTEKQVELIHRGGSEKDTFVKITTDKGELAPRELKVHGRSKADLARNNAIENKSFQHVLLSQEWVATFLLEVDGEKRYEKFMENPLLQEVSNYYIGIKALAGHCDKTIKKLQVDIEEKKQSIQDDSNSDLLEVINSQIKKIVKTYGEQKLSPITLATTKEQIKDLRDFISDKIITSNTEFSTNEAINNINTAKVGDGKIISVSVFFESKNLSGKIAKELDENLIIINKFENLEKLINRLKNNRAIREQVTEKKEQTDKIISQFTKYEQINNDISQKLESNEKKVLELADLKNLAEDLAKEEIKQKNHRDASIKQIEEIKNKKSKLPEVKQRIEILNSDIQKIALLLSSIKKPEEEKAKNELIKIGDSVSEFQKVIDGIKKGKYPFPASDEPSELSVVIKELEDKNIEHHNLKSKLNELNIKIEQQQSLNSTIEEFIKTGLSIANERQDSSCPLCEYKYDSYNQLAERIANNKALNNILKESLKEKNTLLQEITKLDEKIKKNNEIINGFYSKKLEDLLFKKRGIEQRLITLRKEISSNEDTLLQLRKSLHESNIQINGLSTEEYEKQLQLSIQEAVKNRDDSAQLLVAIMEKLTSINEQIQTQNAQIDLVKNEIQKLYKDENYSCVKAWFKSNMPNELISEKILSSKMALIFEKIKTISNEIIELEKDISTLNKDLNIYNKEDVLIQRNELLKKKQEIDQKIDVYYHYLQDRLKIDPRNFDKEKLITSLDEKEREQKARLKAIRELKEEHQKLERYSENIFPFLQSENAKLVMKQKENEVNFLHEKVKPLIEEEKEKTKNYLENKVKNFFYEDLINDLYRKIDPHPEFKRVEFKANFNIEKPTLEVVVTDSDNSRSLIPNLYFSTAQINILSLCIFLASALNSNEYDCIFIDDPIQSLDSINVLSTIDLLRSIVINEDKQIILSTHDENFHNLFKKKIPDNIFKSKFLELETFGKVKREYKKSSSL